MDKLLEPFLVKVKRDEYEYVEERIDSIFRGVSNKMKLNFKSTIKTNNISLIDIKNSVLVAAYHRDTNSIYFNYQYFKDMDKAGYMKIGEDRFGMECHMNTTYDKSEMWKTPMNSFRFEIFFQNNSSWFGVSMLKKEQMNIYWENFSDLQSRKMKIDRFLEFLEDDVTE